MQLKLISSQFVIHVLQIKLERKEERKSRHCILICSCRYSYGLVRVRCLIFLSYFGVGHVCSELIKHHIVSSKIVPIYFWRGGSRFTHSFSQETKFLWTIGTVLPIPGLARQFKIGTVNINVVLFKSIFVVSTFLHSWTQNGCSCS